MNIVLIDDDALVVNALQTILEGSGHTVTAAGKSGEEAVDLFDEHRPDLLMIDIRMNGMTGLEASKKILSTDSDANILVITTFKDDEYIQEALEMGCKGYLLKDNFKGILPAIQAVESGNMVFDSDIVKSMSTSSHSRALTELSKREQQVLELVAEGLSNKEISDQLYLSEGTVRNYISQMLTKLDLRDRTQLAVYFYKN